MRRERASFFELGGKIAPFGSTFTKLARAVAVLSKPIAEYGYSFYNKHKEKYDKRLDEYGLEKIEDPIRASVWFFKSEVRGDAIRRIDEINRIDSDMKRRGYFTPEDHRRKGQLFGYSEADIRGFLAWRSAMILRAYALTGEAEFTYTPLWGALTSECGS
jgi:hypothetical protein